MPSLSRPGQTLTLLIARVPAQALPTTAASSTIWRDGEGSVVAVGGMLENGRWMSIAGVGSFVFDELTSPVTAYPEASVSDELVEDAYRRTVLPLALQALGREVLHASAVRIPSGVLALCAVSGTGKSTTAFALSQRGNRLWADDAVQFSIEGDTVEAIPLAFTLRLKGDAAHAAGLSAVVEETTPAPLAAICVLERGEEPEVTAVRLDSVDAFPAVLTHAYCFELEDAHRKREMMDAYLALVVRVPVFRVTFPAGLEHVESVVDSILEATDS